MLKNLIKNYQAQTQHPRVFKIPTLLCLALIILILINGILWHYTQTFWLLHPKSRYAHWILSDYFFFSYFLSISPLLLWCLDLSKIPKIILKIIGITLLILVMVNQFLARFIGYSNCHTAPHYNFNLLFICFNTSFSKAMP